jgi:hypothetical protein
MNNNKNITGQICITDCKDKNEQFIHPVTLEGIKRNYNACAVFPSQQLSSELDPSQYINDDMCDINDNNKFDTPDEIKIFLLTFNFDPDVFLKNTYKIQSMEDAIKWTLENNKYPYDTIRRIHDCAWKVYGRNSENITTITFEYYYEIVTKHWIKIYLKRIQQKYSFDIITNKKHTDLYDKIKTVILSKILNYDNFIMIIKKCISTNQEQWSYITSHYDFIKEYIYQYIISELDKQDIIGVADSI